jgi:hypothetical protein
MRQMVLEVYRSIGSTGKFTPGYREGVKPELPI